jgi:hypothetical protein
VHKKKKAGGGGLCHWLAKKHHKSKAWETKCITKAKRGRKSKSKRRTRRRATTYNPWAVCHSQGLKKGTRKFERCVQDVKAKNRGRRRNPEREREIEAAESESSMVRTRD